MAEDKYLCGIHYRIKVGKKKPFLVFVHSWGTDITEYDKQLKYFEKKGYSTLAIDLRGSGKSESKPIKIELILKDIKDILDSEKIKKAILVGFSLGGFISLGFLKKFPRYVKKLILINSPNNIKLKNVHFGFTAFAACSLIPILITQPLDKFKTKFFKKINFSKVRTSNLYVFCLHCFFKTSSKSIVSYLWNLKDVDYCGSLDKIKIPVLIIISGRDDLIKEEAILETHNRIKNSKLNEIKDAGHLVFLTHPGLVNKYIEEFL